MRPDIMRLNCEIFWICDVHMVTTKFSTCQDVWLTASVDDSGIWMKHAFALTCVHKPAVVTCWASILMLQCSLNELLEMWSNFLPYHRALSTTLECSHVVWRAHPTSYIKWISRFRDNQKTIWRQASQSLLPFVLGTWQCVHKRWQLMLELETNNYTCVDEWFEVGLLHSNLTSFSHLETSVPWTWSWRNLCLSQLKVRCNIDWHLQQRRMSASHMARPFTLQIYHQ